MVQATAEQIEAPPSFGASVDTDFILGMGKVGQKVVMLLDVDRVLANEEIAAVESTNKPNEGKV